MRNFNGTETKEYLKKAYQEATAGGLSSVRRISAVEDGSLTVARRSREEVTVEARECWRRAEAKCLGSET